MASLIEELQRREVAARHEWNDGTFTETVSFVYELARKPAR